MLTSTGCTRNNGDIGDWFGQWQQTEMLVDGAPNAEYHGQYFWMFQNDIICIMWLAPEGYAHQCYTVYGTWSEQNGSLVLNFDHNEDGDKSSIYIPFSGLHFPAGSPFSLEIVEAGSNKCNLRLVNPDDGSTYTYVLKKRG